MRFGVGQWGVVLAEALAATRPLSKLPRLILPVNNQGVEFIARWLHLFYIFVRYRFNRTTQCIGVAKLTQIGSGSESQTALSRFWPTWYNMLRSVLCMYARLFVCLNVHNFISELRWLLEYYTNSKSHAGSRSHWSTWPSPAPLQTHSPDGSTICDCHQRPGTYRYAAQHPVYMHAFITRLTFFKFLFYALRGCFRLV